MNCPKCNIPMVKNGTRAASNGIIKQRWTCKACHHSEFKNFTPNVMCSGVVTSDTTMNIRSTYRTGHNKASCTVNIPAELARKAGIYEPTPVIVEETSGGLLIKKLEVPA